MKLEDIKAGDTITVYGTGYKSNMHWQYIVKKVTKTQIKAILPAGSPTYFYKFRRDDGMQLPSQRYLNNYIRECNGESIE